ncbi:MAG: hypothetical protein R2940_10820 [Syntrophotaleaceae bacterium]
MNPDNILIVDEQSFGKICTALVKLNGFSTQWASGSEADFHAWDFDRYRMVITSYPYGKTLLQQLEGKQVALLVLSDYSCGNLLKAVESNSNFYCLVKPVDFSRFNDVVNNILQTRTEKVAK